MTSKIIQIIKIVCLRPDTKFFERIAKSGEEANKKGNQIHLIPFFYIK
jgi:hypothetical protein